MTERLHFHFSVSCIGEGNGNPFQCSCLENPRDGGAWWAAVYGVAQSWTRLKWLSSSSSSNAGTDISTVLEGILGRWGGLWLPEGERTLTAVTQEKHLLFLWFDFSYRFFWISFSLISPSIVVVDFIRTKNTIQLLCWFFFFFISVTFLLLLQTSASMLGFCSSVEFSFLFFFFSLF